MSTTAAGTHESRPLGFWTCTALVIGNTIGVGIFLLPATLAPYGLSALWGWLITLSGVFALPWSFQSCRDCCRKRTALTATPSAPSAAA